jgi:FG-GAP repeat
MANIRTVELLPEIFQTPVNQQFLAATLDQLTQNPAFTRTQGYVGRRVGPAVNPEDKYVVEPTAVRTNYQLEPGVIELDPANVKAINNAITYPGITDALKLQGAQTDNADRLYTSEYYTFDPFVDFDKFVNYSQYYWLPSGPDAVDVFWPNQGGVPLTDNFVVTRANGVYTFSGTTGNNPVLTLVRGGNYTFQVSQNAQETINFRVQNSGTSAYLIDYESNPSLTLIRGNTYTFTISLTGPFPFYIKTAASLGTTNLYNTGVQNNGATTGTITFTVPQNAPDTLYYCASNEINMRGTINVVNGTPGTGPGFWIQTDPGVNGRIPTTPNISSRDVLGVSNNGEDLGTVTFNVPFTNAQNFYYDPPVGSLTTVPGVDLVTTLAFSQINNVYVDEFIAANPSGIDGVNTASTLANKTVVFVNQDNNIGNDLWNITTPFDPLPNVGNVVSGTGSFDSLDFDLTTPITDPAEIYSVWQITVSYDSDSRPFMTLSSVRPIADLNKFTIIFGNQYSNTSWYKTQTGIFEQIPLLTATKSLLFYQDGTDPEIFGQIRLIDQNETSVLNIDDIIGQKNYTSPNGVVFTNGLKVTFLGTVSPASYQGNSYYVEGVGTAIQLLPVTDFVTPETYTQSSSVPYDSTPYDVGNFDASLNAPVYPDYLTINRASPDLNAWSRSNRWFHESVINASAAYNNTVPLYNNLQRGRRPILEFRAGTKLFNYGTKGKSPVNIFDLSTTDAFSQVEGSTSHVVDGYALVNGSRVIFANDTDPAVRSQIYVVQFITPDTVPPLIAQPIITLIPATDGKVLADNNVVCLDGVTLQGITFYYDGVAWIPAQEKTNTNQAPLFDIYDANGVSFSDPTTYPSTTFRGSKLFSYAQGSGVTDPILNFALTYFSVGSIGDIIFDNNFYADTFNYTINNTGQTLSTGTGFVRQYSDRTSYTREIGWQTAITPSLSRQQFQFTYDGSPLLLDVAVETNNVVPAVQIFVNATFQDPGTYTISTTASTTTITWLTTHVPGDIVEVLVLSNQISATAFYEVPINLENNPFNGNSSTFTLGTIRSHYETIGQNLLGLKGPIIGSNNTRDLGNIVPYGLQILQQSSPLTLTGYFQRSPEYDIYAALDYNSREYIKYKSQLLETVARNEYPGMTVAEILDSAILDVTLGRTDLNSFYWSDMLPAGTVYTENVTTVTAITPKTFNTNQVYTYTSANYLGLSVYVTGLPVNGETPTVLLVRNIDYVVSTDAAQLTILRTLNVGEVVTIREYSNTAGNFVPNTPTKLGLYPRFVPQIFVDTNYVNATPVIQGHDGSITVAFGDIRDSVLLEFETRIYNNLKTDDNPVPLTIEDVAPGQFRTTDYTQAEITQILGESFLTWVGWNKLDYKTQNFINTNEFTYNYSSSGAKINSSGQLTNTVETPLLGAWRGIYRYFYDTVSPNRTPWEMLGLSEMPTWWTDRYGPAPYTSDNLVLWDDLAAGLVADPVAPYFKPQYARPGLQNVIPVGPEGELLSPLDAVVGQFDSTSIRKSWRVGDGGPVEASWWTSSSYPYAVMRLLALTRPAEFFSLFVDRDLYRYNAELGQYLYKGRSRLDATGIQVYGNGISKASYINWIVDYNQQTGINSTDSLTLALQNLDVRLCYRMAAFSDKQYLDLYTEMSSPNSLNSSLLLPPESYNLLLYKNQPFSEIVYSAVIIEQVADGYAVYGYSNSRPYFEILVSQTNGAQQTISAGSTTVKVPTAYTTNIIQIPYGYVFTNQTVVVDFLLSYGAYLTSQGMIFDNVENGYTLDWKQMAQEFLYWSNQGWAPGTMININPSATKLSAYRPGSVVDTIVSVTPENMLLDQNRTTLATRDLIIQRDGDKFSVTSATTQTISYLDLRFTSYESMIVLDNVTMFADLIYNPITAARQNRIRLTGSVSTDWNGVLNAQGFIENQNNVEQWVANKKYTRGEIVIYKNSYWQALNIVQPKAIFDYADWGPSNYTLIQQGLLPNIANKADQLANSYNVHTANLNIDNDLLAYGLIGFRRRQYMAELDLDDSTQVQLYQGFLPSKGTVLAAELFTRADLGKETGDYNIYENWAILAGTYGAQANKSYIELQLNEANLTANPSTVQIVNYGQTSVADQTIYLSELWATSYQLPNTNILTTKYLSLADSALPNAGYVNFNDVDISVFSLDDPSSIAQNINTIGIGTIIWVAKTNSYDWNIYRCERVPGQMTLVTDNLNGTSTIQFNSVHGLVRGDLIVVRYFNDSINGVYRVISAPTISSITVAYSFGNVNQLNQGGTGLVFYLQTSRVKQASDVLNLPYVTDLRAGAKAWVDNDGKGHWEVIQKQNPFDYVEKVTATVPTANSLFGESVTQNNDHTAALVGSPSRTSVGAVYTYVATSNTQYQNNSILELGATGTVGFGNSVDFAKANWAVAGASASNGGAGYVAVIYQPPGTTTFEITQLLTAPDYPNDVIGFGSAVNISNNGRWLYVGAPGANKVYAYGQVQATAQTANLVGNGSTNYNITPGITGSQNIYSLVVTVNGALQRPNIDYTFSSPNIVFASPVTIGYNIEVNTNTYYEYVGLLPTDGLSLSAGDQFGVSISSGILGREILVGCPRSSAGGITHAGSVFAYDRSVVRYIVDNVDQLTYEIPGTYANPVAVMLNNVYLDNTQFTVSSNAVVLDPSVALSIGNILEIETNQLQLVEQITQPAPVDESAFGTAVKLCHENCSVYTGAPLTSLNYLLQCGSVQRNVNQSRVYGVTTTTVANPSLSIGSTLRINNTEVAVGNDNTIQGLITTINSAGIPNVIATATPNLTLTGDGKTTIFDVGTIYSVATSYTTVVYVDTLLQTAGVNYTYNNTTQQITFTVAPAYDKQILIVSGRMTISVINSVAATPDNKLTVLPGTNGTAFTQLGFVTYAYAQTIQSPSPANYAQFGYSLDIDSNSVNLIVGAPNGNVYEPEVFDGGATYFDEHSTTFFTPIANAGVAYTYDYLPSATDSVTDPGKFVFGQQLYDPDGAAGDRFGAAVNYTNNRLLIGTPGEDTGDLSNNTGAMYLFDNSNDKPSWQVIHSQTPVVDIHLIDTVYSYDRLLDSTQTYYDFIDPLQGKILGAAQRNIDYIGSVDPASYNQGTIHNLGNSWGNQQVGQIWWDTDTVRFIDPSQDSITYASGRWSQLFPGSRIDIYQWTESTVAPSAYVGPGTPLSTTSYTMQSTLGVDGIFRINYYFWVRGITSTATQQGKTLSPASIANYIASPLTSGIPYIAPLTTNAVALYNAKNLISASDTILHIGYDRQATTANIHHQYDLVADGIADSFLNPNLYLKLQDSLCGADSAGNLVPDPNLPVGMRYGVEFSPRQSMFVNRFTALQNYIEYVNQVLLTVPIAEDRVFVLLNSSEPEPSANSGEWNKRVANLAELGYQNLNFVSVGYRYLVASDSDQQGRWSIYQVIIDPVTNYKALTLVRIQSYDTPQYWSYVDWYLPGYNSTINPQATVTYYADLSTLTLTMVPVGGSAKVVDGGHGQFEIYQRTLTGWQLVGIQNGTIQISDSIWNYSLGPYGFDAEVFDAQYFDQEPVVETRKIIQAINQELFTNDLLIYRNRALMLMFDFVYTEQLAPSWLFKTSLIDVDHRIRSLLPYPIYLQDNQDFVLNYIQEVKPYHVQIRQFNLIYSGLDTYSGNMTDFDVPAYWNTLLQIPQFVSPVLTPYTASGSYVENFYSDAPPDSQIWTLDPWKSWFNNYLLELQSVSITNGGSGYTVAPQVTVSAPTTTGGVTAVMTAVISAGGQVVNIVVVNPGSGYVTTPVITFTGGNGTGAQAVAVMGNNLVRSIKTTVKYDRCEYVSTVYEWQANVAYTIGELVRYLDRVWEATTSGSSSIFNPADWTEIPAEDLSASDRTMGYYVPTPNMPGLSLPLLIDGISYPGVQVYGQNYNETGGFDVANFDTTPFDNYYIDANGQVTINPVNLDAIYASAYLDSYLGQRPTDVVVDGGAFISTYASHAPEELVPGAEFDTLDLRVYTATWNPATGTTSDSAMPLLVNGTGTTNQQFLSSAAGTYNFGSGNITFSIGDLAVYNGTIWTKVSGVYSTPSLNFRIFQDMRQVQATYRITPETTTTLTKNLLSTDDIIYVDNASALMLPNVESNIWGVLTINGERIMYRELDIVANTVSSLLRGTGGTAATDHQSGAKVYDMGRNNLMPETCQNYIESDSILADGTETEFTAPSVSVYYEGYDDTLFDLALVSGNPGSFDYGSGGVDTTQAIEVYVGGILQQGNYTFSQSDFNPVTVIFDQAPPAGQEVTILVRKGVTWYNPDIINDTPSNGVALADTSNPCAEFLRGA